MRVARHAGAAILLLLLLQLTGKPVSAQRYNWDLGVNGGWTWWTRPLSLHDFGISDAIIGNQVFNDNFDSDHLRLGSSGIGGATLGYWFRSWLGVRANFAFSEADLSQGDFRLFNSINNWSGTGDVLFRFLKPRERWHGMEWLPYAALGAGAQWLNPSGDNFIMRD